MTYPFFQSYNPFGTLSGASSPTSNNSTHSPQRYGSQSIDPEVDNPEDESVEHVSEDEYEAMLENPHWPSVFAPPAKGMDFGPPDLTGYTSTVPWASPSVIDPQRTPSIIAIVPRRGSLGAEARRSSLSKVWAPGASPEEHRRASESSMVDYNATEPRARLQLQAARSLGSGRSTSLLAQAARRRSSAQSSASQTWADPEEAEQVRRIRSMDILGRRFSEAVYIEPVEPESPDEDSSSEEEQDRDWTPDLQHRVNKWSPDTCSDEEVISLASPITPNFQPAIAELSNFPLASSATLARSLGPSPTIDYLAGGVARGPITQPGSLQGWQFPPFVQQPNLPPSQYLSASIPPIPAHASLRIGSTLGQTSPPFPQSAFRRSASSPLFAARNGDVEAFSRPAAVARTVTSLRSMAPMKPAPPRSSGPHASGRPALPRYLSDCREETSPEIAVELPPVAESGAESLVDMSRKGSYVDEVQQFRFLATEITVGDPTLTLAPIACDTRALPNFAGGWTSTYVTTPGLANRYNPMESFLGKSTASTVDQSAFSPPGAGSPSTVLAGKSDGEISPLPGVEARYQEESAETDASPDSPPRQLRPRSGASAIDLGRKPWSEDYSLSRTRPRSGDIAVIKAEAAGSAHAVQAPQWRSPWPHPPRLVRSATEPALIRAESPTGVVARKPVPVYCPETPDLCGSLSPESGHSKETEVPSNRGHSHRRSKRCRRCEEKAKLKLAVQQLRIPQQAAAVDNEAMSRPPESAVPALQPPSYRDSTSRTQRPGMSRIASARPAVASPTPEKVHHRRRSDLAYLFPQPPIRNEDVACPHPSGHVAAGISHTITGSETSSASPVAAPGRLTFARTPSPKRQNEQRRTGSRASGRQETAIAEISAPILISSTSNRMEIPVGARGPPVTSGMLAEATYLTRTSAEHSRPAVRHPVASMGSFPQDPTVAASNPNASATQGPRPDFRRAATSLGPGGPEAPPRGHLMKRPSSNFLKFLHNLPVGSPRRSDPMEQAPAMEAESSPNASEESHGSRQGLSPDLSEGRRMFAKGHNRSSSSVSSSATTVGASGRSRPTSSSSSGSDKTLVDLKETFKLFAASAKGKTILVESVEEDHGEDSMETLRDEKSGGKTAGVMLGNARRPRFGRNSSVAR